VGEATGPIQELRNAFGDTDIKPQPVQDEIPTAWVPRPRLHEVLKHLQSGIPRPYRVLYDVTVIDERTRLESPPGLQSRDFTMVYHLLSYDRNEDVRIKVAIADGDSMPTATDIWPAANWYEREVWDMFGVRFDGHPLLERILMPRWWKGHPLRKEHLARATEMEPYQLPDWRVEEEEADLQFHPEFKSKPDKAHPLFREFIGAAVKFSNL
jgi:NADH-quinone oxidoreductase subunit C/D